MPKYNIFKCINSSISCLYSLDWKEDDERPYYIYWILILMKLRRGWSGITFRFHRRRFIVILPPQFFTLAYFLKLLGVVFPSWMKFFIKTIRHKILDRHWGVSQYKISKKCNFGESTLPTTNLTVCLKC